MLGLFRTGSETTITSRDRFQFPVEFFTRPFYRRLLSVPCRVKIQLSIDFDSCTSSYLGVALSNPKTVPWSFGAGGQRSR